MNAKVIAFLDNFPLLPLLQIAVNSLLICTALFMLSVLKETQLHINCRFLLVLWSFLSLIVFTCHTLLGVFNIIQDGGYLPANMMEPAWRNDLYKIEMSAIFFTICVEVMLATERVLSSVDPEKYYHRKNLTTKVVLPCIILSLFFAILINTFATRYCKRRDLELYGSCSLNARYQVKESSDMASAMQRALVITFSMKVSPFFIFAVIFINSVNTIFLACCYALDDVTHACIPILFEAPFGFLETLYALNMSLNGGFLMIWLLHNHPRLHRNARRILRVLKPPSSVGIAAATETLVQRKSEAELYMDALKRAWM
ncbi:hypothetical protein PMAYCL1PPCAC_15503 [Pristionchus mayeri]|uniref:G protein-coupled receptor n=1 Tax=Pristionchus mayeri TaxID=1317129 RepID=A0AAN5CJ30_9BILA|nr:hypothetical protein PMAYCL1PPCAC_15503 [Pristionchus mayeri]